MTRDEIEQIEKDIQSAEIRGDAHVVFVLSDSNRFRPQVLAEERRRSEAAVQKSLRR